MSVRLLTVEQINVVIPPPHTHTLTRTTCTFTKNFIRDYEEKVTMHLTASWRQGGGGATAAVVRDRPMLIGHAGSCALGRPVRSRFYWK